MRQFFIYFMLLFSLSTSYADESLLSNIQQLTFPSMGFKSAGEAYFSPDGQMVSFQAIPEGQIGYQIFILDLNTEEVRQISREAKTCTCSFFHPDGKKIIFAASPVERSDCSNGRYKWDFTPYMNIYEADLDGSNTTALTYGSAYHAECAYSPDGSQIVYASNEDGHMNLYTMQSDGSNVRQLTFDTNCYNGGPFFSPDGEKLIFRSDPDCADLLQIYMMDCKSLERIKVTYNEAVNWAPFWHPSQKYIAYTTSLHGHKNYEIYLYSFITGNSYRVTDQPRFDGLPTFNREGTKMLWTSKRGDDHTSQVFIADFQLPDES